MSIGSQAVAAPVGAGYRVAVVARTRMGRCHPEPVVVVNAVPAEPVLTETGTSSLAIASVGAALAGLGIAALSWSRRRPARSA